MFGRQEIERAGLGEVVRQMPAAAFIFEAPSGEIVLVNKQARQMIELELGRPMPSELGSIRDLYDSGDFEMLHPDGRPYELEEWPLMRAIGSGEEVRDEIADFLVGSTRIPVHCNSSPVYDDEGRIVAGVVVVYDMTEQKRAEEHLAYHARLEENINDAFIATDEQYGLTAWNKGAEELYGWRAEEVLGRSVLEVARTDLSDEQLAEARRQLDETDRWRAEVIAYRKDGSSVWVELTNVAVRRNGGEVTGYIGIHRDITERKHDEERLARYAHLEENIDDAFIATDERLLVKAWNRGAERMYGVRADEALGRDAREVVSLEMSDEQLAEALQEVEETGRLRVEQLQHRKDGTPLHVDSLSIAMHDERGETTSYLSINRDITERKRAEEALRASSRRIESILESITDDFWAVDHDWRFTYVNDRTMRVFSELKGKEFTREELVGQSVWEVFPNIVGTLADEKYRQAVAEQKPAVFEYHYPGEGVVEGEESPWFEIHLYPSEEGLSVYYQDITERKRAQEEIETRHHQQAVVAELGLRALSESNLQSLMGEAVALVARTLEVEYSKIVDLLPGGEEMLLRAGMGWREGLVGNATEESGLDSQAGYTLVSEEPVFVEDQSTETRFSPSWLLREHGVVSSLTVVIHGQDEPFGVLGVHTTSHRTFSEDDANFVQAVANVLVMAIERKEAEKRLNEVREVERSRIARDLHDEVLRNLTYALVEAQHVHSLSKDPQQADRMGRLVAALDRIGPQLRGAIYDLRLEGEEDKPFYELLESLVELQRTIAPDCEISLDVGDGLLSDPLGERGRELLRIIGEMLTNARRHSGAQNVWVAVWTSEDEKLCAEVSDDGRGFDSSEEPSATITTGGGMGIKGMRERARALGGELEIKSEPGKGTKVRFELVLKKDRQEEPKEEEPEKVHILLVEDHATVREAIASAFEREAGFEVVGQAVSLAEARQMLEEAEPVDVAVVDLGLPDGYGGDLIKDLRAAHSQAQALVLSASLDRTEIAGAVERGAAGILNKTSHLDEVVEAVRRLRAGETLIPLEEVVDLLRFAGSRREEEHEARQVIARLTPREREVLRALAEGLSSEGIAERLNISVRTQRNHMTNILAKLGVHSQLQALVFALRHGVVEIP